MMEHSLPAVSIGIPFYNAEAFLLESVKSVLAQSHQDWELILMDDGSTDNSLALAQSIDDPRVRVYSDGQNKKLAARLNDITALAKHDYIARMDADDLIDRRRIEKQLRFLQQNPHCDLVTTGLCSITDDGVPLGIRMAPANHSIDAFAVLNGGHGIVHASVVGRKDWFLRNPYDPKDYWGEDYKLWIRSFKKNDLAVGYIEEPLYFYREEGSATPEKMIAGKKIRRQVVLEHGPTMIGQKRTKKLANKLLMQQLIIQLAARLNLTKRIVRARSNEAPQEMLDSVQQEIEQIRALELVQR